ncbi:MAG: hypothetical protein HYX33_00985 [Actinobacteria bacterium]|nr:hypothetical protein [Actinomycetota bacterium]
MRNIRLRYVAAPVVWFVMASSAAGKTFDPALVALPDGAVVAMWTGLRSQGGGN